MKTNLYSFLLIVFCVVTQNISAQYDYEIIEDRTDSSNRVTLININDQDTSITIYNRLRKSDSGYYTRYYRNSDVIAEKGRIFGINDSKIGRWKYYRPDGTLAKILNYTTGKIEYWADDTLKIKGKLNSAVRNADSILRLYMCDDFIKNYISVDAGLYFQMLESTPVNKRVLNSNRYLPYRINNPISGQRLLIGFILDSNLRIETINDIPLAKGEKCKFLSKEILDEIVKDQGIRGRKKKVSYSIENRKIKGEKGFQKIPDIEIRFIELEVSYYKEKKEFQTLEYTSCISKQQKHLKVTLCPYTGEVLFVGEKWITISRSTTIR